METFFRREKKGRKKRRQREGEEKRKEKIRVIGKSMVIGRKISPKIRKRKK